MHLTHILSIRSLIQHSPIFGTFLPGKSGQQVASSSPRCYAGSYAPARTLFGRLLLVFGGAAARRQRAIERLITMLDLAAIAHPAGVAQHGRAAPSQRLQTLLWNFAASSDLEQIQLVQRLNLLELEELLAALSARSPDELASPTVQHLRQLLMGRYRHHQPMVLLAEMAPDALPHARQVQLYAQAERAVATNRSKPDGEIAQRALEIAFEKFFRVFGFSPLIEQEKMVRRLTVPVRLQLLTMLSAKASQHGTTPAFKQLQQLLQEPVEPAIQVHKRAQPAITKSPARLRDLVQSSEALIQALVDFVPADGVAPAVVAAV